MELPTGTVTFLFSDIEGSTRLLAELGDGYADALAEHRRVLRRSFERHHGVEVDTQGDAFFVAFGRATDAVAAAVDAQVAFAAGPVRVRMGLHTGEPLVTEEGYVGIDVHRAARVAAAGHGGQVLLSQPTRDLVAVEVRDLGLHRLKDLSAAERLFQLGSSEFPPLQTLYQTNLPVQPWPLVGRERELAEVLGFLHDGTRLLTLTGAGGSGKTRLALHAAAELAGDFADGVWFVSLAPVRDPSLVEATVAQVLGVQGEVLEHLRSRRLLLLLDNLEHLLEAATWIAELLAVAPDLRVLATSRERLAVAAEQEYVVPTLALPEASELFVERARRLVPSFQPDEHVEAIAQRLDGLPLALELAAARVKVLAPSQIRERLAHSFALVSGGGRDVPDRQRTLRATLEWSLDLLDTEERELFFRLGVFAGSFSLDAAEEVAGADVDALASLVDKSLLRSLPDGRFFYLEPIRELALERLRSLGDEDALRERQAAFHLRVLPWSTGFSRSEEIEWSTRVAAEHQNLRATLAWLVEHDRYPDALRLIHATAFHWEARATDEGYRWCVAALEGAAPSDLRANVLRWGSGWAAVTGRLDAAVELADEAVSLSRARGDPDDLGWSLTMAASARGARREYDQGRALFEESLAATPPDSVDRMRLLHFYGEFELDAGNLVRGRMLLEDSLQQAKAQHDNGLESIILHGLGDAALLANDPEAALACYRKAALLARETEDTGTLLYCLAGLAASAACRGDLKTAALLWGALEQREAEEGLKIVIQGRERYEQFLPPSLDSNTLADGRALTEPEIWALAHDTEPI